MQAVALSALLTLGFGHDTGLILTEEDQRLYKLDEGTIQMMHLHTRAGGEVPKELNWASKMPPVKDQGNCGSCWAFAAADALAGRHAVKNGEKIDISEQHFLDCTYPGDRGCKGGNSLLAWHNVARFGVAAQDKYKPYTAKVDQCPSVDEFQKKGFKRNAFAGDSAKDPVTHEYFSGPPIELKEELAKYGPCAMFLGTEITFAKYKGGVWRCSKEQTPNHAVTVVGYGTEDGEDYWLVKNSWGTQWGDNGFIKVSIEHCPMGDIHGVAAKCPEVRKLPYKPPEEEEDELWEATPGAMCSGEWEKRTLDSLTECKARCQFTPGCIGIDYGHIQGDYHTCTLCKADKLTKGKHVEWVTNYKYTGPVAEMIYDNGGCAKIGAELGKEHAYPGECLAAALKNEKCGGTIMYSKDSNWKYGCNCCTKDGLGGKVDPRDPHKVFARFKEEEPEEEEKKKPAIDCAPWKCACQGISDKFGANHGITWGQTPPEARKWWMMNRCTTKPLCESWGCTCKGLSDKFGTDHGVTWGKAPVEAQRWWSMNRCTTKPGQPEPKCDVDYIMKKGHIAGRKLASVKVKSCWECAGLCNDNVDCKSYECSPSAKQCNLNAFPEPTAAPYKDYMFCTKDCKDSNKACANWGAHGECDNNPEYMLDNCKKSCAICIDDTDDGVCKDNHARCEEWAAHKQCDLNPGYMHVHCRKSCKECEAEDACEDKNENCAGWAKAGECKKNPWYMIPNCPASCGTCDDEPLKTAVGYCKPNTAASRIGGLKHVKGFVRDIDCYLARCAFDKTCVASSLGKDGECIAYSECSGMEPNPAYKTTFKPKPKRPVCNRPKDGCTAEGDLYQTMDCDRDGVLDHVCTNIKGPIRQWVALSSSGDCSKWVFDKGGMCRPPAGTVMYGYCKPNTPESRIGGMKRHGPYKSGEKCFADRCAKDAKCVAITLGKDGECIAYSKCTEIIADPNYKTMVKPGKPAPRRLSDIMEAKALEMEEMDASAAPVNELMPPAPAY